MSNMIEEVLREVSEHYPETPFGGSQVYTWIDSAIKDAEFGSRKWYYYCFLQDMVGEVTRARFFELAEGYVPVGEPATLPY